MVDEPKKGEKEARKVCDERRGDSTATKRDGMDKVVERVAEGRLQGEGREEEGERRDGGRERESLSATECLAPCGIEARTRSPAVSASLSRIEARRPSPSLVLVLVFVLIAIPAPVLLFHPLPPSFPLDLSPRPHRRPLPHPPRFHVHGQRLREGETSLFPSLAANTEIDTAGTGAGGRGGIRTRREISLLVPFSLRPPATPIRLSLPPFLRVPLSSAVSFDGIGRARGVTNPSRIRIAAPTVGIRRAIGPDDTRKPNGKRKYDADFRSAKRIRETPDRAGLLSLWSPSLLIPDALYPPPRPGHLSFSLRPSPSLLDPPSLLFRHTCSQSHPNAGNSTIGRGISRLDSIGRRPFPVFRRGPERKERSEVAEVSALASLCLLEMQQVKMEIKGQILDYRRRESHAGIYRDSKL